MVIVVEVVVLWLMIGGDSRHKVVGGAQASLILGSNPVLGTCLLHHSAPPNSTRGDNPRLSTSCRALELQVGLFPALCSFPKRSTLRRCQSGSRLVGGWWDKAWRLGRPSPTWRKLALGERGVSARVPTFNVFYLVKHIHNPTCISFC